jgi:hypothetical protein
MRWGFQVPGGKGGARKKGIVRGSRACGLTGRGHAANTQVCGAADSRWRIVAVVAFDDGAGNGAEHEPAGGDAVRAADGDLAGFWMVHRLAGEWGTVGIFGPWDPVAGS